MPFEKVRHFSLLRPFLMNFSTIVDIFFFFLSLNGLAACAVSWKVPSLNLNNTNLKTITANLSLKKLTNQQICEKEIKTR